MWWCVNTAVSPTMRSKPSDSHNLPCSKPLPIFFTKRSSFSCSDWWAAWLGPRPPSLWVRWSSSDSPPRIGILPCVNYSILLSFPVGVVLWSTHTEYTSAVYIPLSVACIEKTVLVSDAVLLFFFQFYAFFWFPLFSPRNITIWLMWCAAFAVSPHLSHLMSRHALL